MKEEIIKLIKELAVNGSELVHFSTPIIVKTTPHTPTFYIWGVSHSPLSFHIQVMDHNEDWHQCEGDLILNSIYQRLKVIQTTLKESA